MISLNSASHNNKVLNENLMKSDFVRVNGCTVYTNCKNIADAYNKINKYGDVIIYIHHDVYLPDDFEKDLKNSIKKIEKKDKNWAVIGVAGVRLDNGKKQNIGYINDRGNIWGSPKGLPAEVDTLDEMLLITHGDFVFDENLPLDFYGADICLQAKEQGRKCYAINAFCHHNSTRKIGERTKSFYESEKYFKEKWKKHLPIATTCSMLS